VAEIKLGKLLGEGTNDSDEWHDSCAVIDLALAKLKVKPSKWRAEVKNFGWQKLSGHREFRGETGTVIMSAILPDTSCTFKIYRYGKGFAVNNAHHDSPTWDEWYYITPMRA
jgi:hypothetical protein